MKPFVWRITLESITTLRFSPLLYNRVIKLDYCFKADYPLDSRNIGTTKYPILASKRKMFDPLARTPAAIGISGLNPFSRVGGEMSNDPTMVYIFNVRCINGCYDGRR